LHIYKSYKILGMNPYKKIALIGGTGKAGNFLIDQLIKQGYQIKALARNPEKLRQTSLLVEKIKGDARKYESVFSLLQGCDAVISTIGPSKNEPDTCSIVTGHVIHAMQTLNMKRYIELAGLAIDTPSDKKGFMTKLLVRIMKSIVPAKIADRQKGYRLLSESNLDWTLVRSSMIEQTDKKRTVKTSLLDSTGRKVSSTDLALFLINQLLDDQFIRKAPFISS
jgi:putative NADH-flavin reductase